MRAAFGALLSSLLLLVCAKTAAQPTVRVRSEARIELRVTRNLEHVVVEGALRDDLGEPLPGREVILRANPEAPGGTPLRYVLTSDGIGEFRARLELSGGTYRLRAAFTGDATHERIEVERPLDLDRADVRLRVDVPGGGRLDLDRPQHRFEVIGRSEAGGAGLALDLLDELDRPLAHGTTDASGRVVFLVSSEALGPPGAGRVKARSRSDEERAEAQTEVPIVRFRTTQLALRASRTEARRGERVRFSGSLRDSAGPLHGRAVGLFEGQQHLATMLTDGDGAFSGDVSLGDDHRGTVEVVGRYESDSPGRASSESEPVVLTVAPPRSAPWQWLLLPLVICASLVAFISRRAPKRPERSVSPPREPPRGIHAARRRALRGDRTDLSGRVLDHRSDEPLADAEVELSSTAGAVHAARTGDDGHFRIAPIAAGTWTLRIWKDGFSTDEATVQIPHRGEWSDASVRLESMRSRALSPYKPVAAELLPAPRLWSIWTSREVLAQAGRVGRRAAPLDELTERVEEAYYGPRPPTTTEVAAIEERAESALQQLRPQHPTAPDRH